MVPVLRNDADNFGAVVLANRFQKVLRVWHFAYAKVRARRWKD